MYEKMREVRKVLMESRKGEGKKGGKKRCCFADRASHENNKLITSSETDRVTKIT